jgi:NADPH-dependent 7-cyano-7-deazaguanine reductase QueF
MRQPERHHMNFRENCAIMLFTILHTLLRSDTLNLQNCGKSVVRVWTEWFSNDAKDGWQQIIAITRSSANNVS